MVLAAGLGKRMRPITDTMPKPMVSVAGKPLLDHALDALAAFGVRQTVVNVHYLAQQIEHHVADRTAPSVIISDERAVLLDSGGGVKKAIRSLPDGPFFILNADSFWVDRANANLSQMSHIWNDKVMDMLLLVAKKDQAVGFDGLGDFFMDEEGRLARRETAPSAPYIYAGAIVAEPALFEAVTEDAFSLNRLFDQAIENRRLYGCPLDGLWLHVGTPEAIPLAEAAIDSYQSKA